MIVADPPETSRGRGRPTIEDVARQACTSRQTVSRVINGNRWVSADARARVLEAIETLGYRRNALAGGLRSGRTLTLGLLVANVVNPLFAAEARGVQDVADQAGYQVMLGNTDEDLPTEQRLLQLLQEKQVDGIVAIPAGTGSHQVLEDLQAAGVPIVLLNRALRGFDSVVFDWVEGFHHATQHLAQQGHRRIALLVGAAIGSAGAVDRLEGYRAGLADSGVSFDAHFVLHTDFDEPSNFELARSLLARPDPPTAIIASSSLTSVSVLRAARSLGLAVPEQVAVVGANVGTWGEVTDPPLSTLHVDAYALGGAAAELLVRRLRGDLSAKPTVIRHPIDLIVRRSSQASPRPAVARRHALSAIRA